MKPTLRLGDRSIYVSEMQIVVGAKVDGVFGSKDTLPKVKAWQKSKGLVPDAIWGPKCWAASGLPDAPVPQVRERIFGIDISYVQRNAVDWPKLQTEAKCEFGIYKATEGNTGRDPTFLSHLTGARGVNMPSGAYGFGRPDSSLRDAEREAEFMYTACGGLGSQQGELPPFLDLEATKLTGPQTLTWMVNWLKRGDSLWGRKVGLYTGAYYLEGLGKMSDEVASILEGRAIWLAQYPIDYKKQPQLARTFVPREDAKPRVPRPFKTWTIWQWAGTGGPRIPGLKVDVDCNFYNGSLEDFRKELLSF